MKKTVSLLLCVIMIAAVFAGCGASSELTAEGLVGEWSLDISGVDEDALLELMSSTLGQSAGVGGNAEKLFDALGSDYVVGMMNDVLSVFTVNFEKDMTMKCEIVLDDFKGALLEMITKMYGKLGEMDLSQISDILGQSEDEIKQTMDQTGAATVKELFDKQAETIKLYFDYLMNEETMASMFGENAQIEDGTAYVGENVYMVEGNKIIMVNKVGKETSLTVNYFGDYLEITGAEGAEGGGGEQVAAMMVKGAKLVRK